ncbi:UNVERIFIED_CONTAM: Retrovirus-related Pol polyprotein from transposon.6 [Sesamum radiatum]|uniref:Retrovirus-related Pol polyprotein from transposon.6 n=1 Tax=Sesamum radiatum TaxID=300843 RepID=A0AAW2N9H1_SESRA
MGFYRYFVHRYAVIAGPLTELLKSGGFLWSDSATAAFSALEKAMICLPILAPSDFSTTLKVTTDVSSTTIRVVLFQDGVPLAFFSKKLNEHLQAASTYVRKLYAIAEAIKK